MSAPKKITCLVINPNSSTSMTKGLDLLIDTLGHGGETKLKTYTAPSGPSSINNEDDAQRSAEVCLPDLANHMHGYQGFVVACYSVHPLVPLLKSKLPSKSSGFYTPVVGIFESSISAALALLSPPSPLKAGAAESYDKFGIVSTGKYWEKALTEGVLNYMGVEDVKDCKRFKGVETTGLSAEELHTAPPEEVRARMTKATRRLVKDGDVSVICLGCAGMAGMDEMVEAACIEELGAEKAKSVRIVDGVKAAVGMLEGLVRAQGT